MNAPQNPRVTQADEAFARKMADDFLPDMDTPSLSARHVSIMAAVKNGIHHGRTQAEAEAKAREAALVEALDWILPLLERVDTDDIPITQADLPRGKLHAAFRAQRNTKEWGA